MIEKKENKALQHLLHVPVGSTKLHDIFCYTKSFCGNSTLPEQTGRIAARHLARAQTFKKKVQSIMIKLRGNRITQVRQTIERVKTNCFAI